MSGSGMKNKNQQVEQSVPSPGLLFKVILGFVVFLSLTWTVVSLISPLGFSPRILFIELYSDLLDRVRTFSTMSYGFSSNKTDSDADLFTPLMITLRYSYWLLLLFLLGYFLWFLLNTTQVPADKKPFWAAVLFILQPPAFVVFYFLYVIDAPGAEDPERAAAGSNGDEND